MARSPNRSRERSVAGLIHWSGRVPGRIGRAWSTLPKERKLAVGAALGLIGTVVLPWYQETAIVPGLKAPTTAGTSVTGWGHFSFVEAAVLLVAVGVLTLLVQRAEGRAFHLPGGDGGVITIAGVWACALMIWQVFDRPSAIIHGAGVSVSGLQWGIFVALGVAGLLAYAGTRIQAAHRPEPPLPWDEAPTVARPSAPVRRQPGWLSARPEHLDPAASDPEALTIARERAE